MNSITHPAEAGNQGNAPVLPILAPKEPKKLYLAPEHSPYTRDNIENPRAYSTSDILNSLTERGFERFSNAEWRAKNRRYRVELGSEHFTDEQLATARQELAEAETEMEVFVFFEWVGWGMPLEAWQAHTPQLTELLKEAQGEKEGWRFGPPGLTGEDLLRALVEKEVSD